MCKFLRSCKNYVNELRLGIWGIACVCSSLCLCFVLLPWKLGIFFIVVFSKWTKKPFLPNGLAPLPHFFLFMVLLWWHYCAHNGCCVLSYFPSSFLMCKDYVHQNLRVIVIASFHCCLLLQMSKTIPCPLWSYTISSFLLLMAFSWWCYYRCNDCCCVLSCNFPSLFLMCKG